MASAQPMRWVLSLLFLSNLFLSTQALNAASAAKLKAFSTSTNSLLQSVDAGVGASDALVASMLNYKIVDEVPTAALKLLDDAYAELQKPKPILTVLNTVSVAFGAVVPVLLKIPVLITKAQVLIAKKEALIQALKTKVNLVKAPLDVKFQALEGQRAILAATSKYVTDTARPNLKASEGKIGDLYKNAPAGSVASIDSALDSLRPKLDISSSSFDTLKKATEAGKKTADLAFPPVKSATEAIQTTMKPLQTLLDQAKKLTAKLDPLNEDLTKKRTFGVAPLAVEYSILDIAEMANPMTYLISKLLGSMTSKFTETFTSLNLFDNFMDLGNKGGADAFTLTGFADKMPLLSDIPNALSVPTLEVAAPDQVKLAFSDFNAATVPNPAMPAGVNVPSPSCFVGSSRVVAQGQQQPVLLRSLQKGDFILGQHHSSALRFEAVLDFVHAVYTPGVSHITVEHDKGLLQVSSNHLLFLWDDMGYRKEVAAEELRSGDRLQLASGESSEVLAVSRDESDQGLLSPLTSSGTIFVDGVVASNYADVDGLNVPHGWNGPWTLLYRGRSWLWTTRWPLPCSPSTPATTR
eukprot:TRINITY_DN22282_c0_g1_i1.p1 TRINITY_DN22282_c0_g1~~TRINITY_DN22282_c0_g1_i1.p1  ORF type:complete len:618 (-),score=105.46 TRINITY_DN22282_c0_g1_i1:82-1821(-)